MYMYFRDQHSPHTNHQGPNRKECLLIVWKCCVAIYAKILFIIRIFIFLTLQASLCMKCLRSKSIMMHCFQFKAYIRYVWNSDIFHGVGQKLFFIFPCFDFQINCQVLHSIYRENCLFPGYMKSGCSYPRIAP